MNQQVCDTERLNAFVQGTLDADAELDLTGHLDECESCGLTLESKVAEAAVWRDASKFLGGGDEFSEADVCKDRQEHRNAQIQHVLTQLAPTDDPDSLGRIGSYEVTGVIGSGGMGVVLKAHDRPLDRVVAVKVMAPHLAASGSARQRFAREAKAAAAVLHPNVIAIHGVSSDQTLPFLVMPYVPGSSLQTRIDAEGPLPMVDILRIGSQVAAGLAAAHGQGLVHRDIKPANILLEQGVERVTITDFGLARAVDDASMTRSGVIAGTPQYMSPEQARGEPIDHRSDLFSLGSLLYAMCTGHSPFRAETSFGVLHRITHDSPRPIRELNPGIPEWLEAIVMKLLAKSRDDRFDSAGHVADLLEDCLAHVQRATSEPLPKGLEKLKPFSEVPHGSGSGNRVLKGLLALGFGAFLAIAGTIIYLETGKGTIRIETNSEVPVPIVIRQSDEVVDELTVSHTGERVQLRAGNYVIEVNGDKTGITILGDQVRLSRGEEWLATVSVNDEQPQAQSKDAPNDRPGSTAVVMLMHSLRIDNGRQVQLSAASVALGQLLNTDSCGILQSTSNGVGWLWGGRQGVISLTDQRPQFVRAISNSSFGKLSSFDPALSETLHSLTGVNSINKHMIILTDGSPSLQSTSVLNDFRDAGIKISVVYLAVGIEGGEKSARLIATQTGGRFYSVRTLRPSVVERIYLREMRTAKTQSDSKFSESSPARDDREKGSDVRSDEAEAEAAPPSLQAQIMSWQKQLEAATESLQASESRLESSVKIVSDLKSKLERRQDLKAQAIIVLDSSISDAERKCSIVEDLLAASEETTKQAEVQYRQFKARNEKSSDSPKVVEQYEQAKAKTSALELELSDALTHLTLHQNRKQKLSLKMRIENAAIESQFARAEARLKDTENEVKVNRRDVAKAKEKLRQLQSDKESSHTSDPLILPTENAIPTATSNTNATVLADELTVGGMGIQVVGNQIIIRGEKSEIESARKQFDKLDSTNLDPEGTNRFGIPHVVRLANADGEKLGDGIREICAILGILVPQYMLDPGKPHLVYTHPQETHTELATSWLTLYDVLHSDSHNSAEAKLRLAHLRREVLRHLKKQVERKSKRLWFDELVLIEQEKNGQELSQARVLDLRQRAASTYDALQRDAQKAARELDLDRSVGNEEQTVVSTYPMTYVESQKAQTIIMDISKLFGLFPEMPLSDVRTNMLTIGHHGREEYFKCLAAMIDGSGPETESTDQQMEQWKLRIRFLAMLERMLEAGTDDSSPEAIKSVDKKSAVAPAIQEPRE